MAPDDLAGVLISFCCFCGERNKIIFKEISFFVNSKIGHLLLHILTIIQVSYEYLPRKSVFGLQQNIRLSHFHTSSKLLKCCSASAYPIN